LHHDMGYVWLTFLALLRMSCCIISWSEAVLLK